MIELMASIGSVVVVLLLAAGFIALANTQYGGLCLGVLAALFLVACVGVFIYRLFGGGT